MLKAVVEQVELRSELTLGKHAGRVAVFSDNDWDLQAPRHQEWFIAEVGYGASRIDQGHAPGLAPVAAGENIELDPSLFEQLPQKEHERRFARSANGQVSDAHYRSPKPLGASDAAVIKRIPRANPDTEE